MSEVEHTAAEVDFNVPEEEGTDVLFALLVTNMRLYDVTLALFNHFDEEGAMNLINMHRQGKLVGPVPIYTGEHVVPLDNDSGDDTDDTSD